MRYHKHVGICLLALFGIAPGLAAQDVEDLRAQYRIELPKVLAVPAGFDRATPGNAAASPSAFGANFGDGFVGVGYQQRTRYTDTNDGGVVMGFGWGNSRDLVGVEVAITSFSTFRQGFGENMGVTAKFHKILPWSSAVAVGWENFAHGAGTDGGTSPYAVASKVFSMREGGEWFSTATASLGVGGGRFRSEDDVLADDGGIGVFGSLGVRLAPAATAIVDWTGQDLAVGMSLAPFRKFPLIFTPAFVDVLEQAGDGARFSLGVGYGFTWGSLSE